MFITATGEGKKNTDESYLRSVFLALLTQFWSKLLLLRLQK